MKEQKLQIYTAGLVPALQILHEVYLICKSTWYVLEGG